MCGKFKSIIIMICGCVGVLHQEVKKNLLSIQCISDSVKLLIKLNETNSSGPILHRKVKFSAYGLCSLDSEPYLYASCSFDPL